MNVNELILGLTDSLVDQYNSHKDALANGHAPIVNKVRQEALVHFSKLGIPGTKVENYKYTNMQTTLMDSYLYDLNEDGDVNEAIEQFKCDVADLQSHQIFVVNGCFVMSKSLASMPQGVELSSFKQFAVKHPQLVEAYYGKAAPMESDGIVAYNSLLAHDGYAIYIPKGVVVEQPIQIVNILAGKIDRMVNQRNLIVLDENSQARVLVCDHVLSPNKYFANIVTEVFVGERSVFDVYNIQSQHNYVSQVAGTYIRQKAQSSVMSNNLTLHAGRARNNIHVHMDGEYSESHVYGLYLNDKNQHVDNFVIIDHAKPNCTSTELFKGVIDDYATAAFTGRILVQRDAQKTNAYQSCNNLLLTSDAKVYAKPQLEIYADDVKCSHGATVGQLDENSMFYLRSRGLGVEEARILLMYAFAYEVVDKIRVEPLKEQIRGMVEKRFRGELDKCDSCVVCGNKSNKTGCL